MTSTAKSEVVVFDQKLLEERAYWVGRLSRDLGVSSPRLDYPRPGGDARPVAEVELHIAGDVYRRLAKLTAGGSFLLYATMMAALKICLHKYTGNTTIVVGSPARLQEQAPRQPANVLAIVDDVNDQVPFRQFLLNVRQTLLDAYARQRYPFERVLKDLGLRPSEGRNPLFDVVLALNDIHTRLPELNNSITILLRKEPDQLVGRVAFAPELFKRESIERFTKHYVNVLRAALEDTNTPIGALEVLTEAERHQLLVEWNDTAAAYPSDMCIHQLFEQQVERTPDAPALVFDRPLRRQGDKETRRQGDKETRSQESGVRSQESEFLAPNPQSPIPNPQSPTPNTQHPTPNTRQLTYRELNARANQLARFLRNLDVGAGDLIGIWMEHAPEMITGLLAVEKAGAAYVPLDPAWPAERTLQILSSLKIPCILTQYAQLRAIHDLQWKLADLTDVVCLDIAAPKPPPEPLDPDAVRAVWDYMAEKAVDRASAGGFFSSYTGSPFPEAEVDQYRDRVVALAEPYLGPQKRVLEIGCGAGLIMFAIAPRVGRYIGLDPSEGTQRRNREQITKDGHANVELITGFAHEIQAMQADSLDLIIMASTIQFFPGPLYLKQVIEMALRLLAPGGAILIADVMDSRQKDDFRASIAQFQSRHGDQPSITTKTQLDSELYLDEDLFYDLEAEFDQIADIRVLYRGDEFKNELRYRCDVLLQKAGSGDGSARFAGQRLCQKRLWTCWHFEQLAESNLAAPVRPDDIAYIIHTSGSTGVPKGVVVQHRAVVNLIDWVNRAFRVGPSDRILFVTSLCFDLSVYDIFGLLAAGGSIQVVPEADLKEPERLLQLLCSTPITFWDSAPAMLQQLVPLFPSLNPINRRSALRLAFLSGDWIPIKLPAAIKAVFPGVEVISLGGATEATVWSNFYPIGDLDPLWVSIPYGKPIQNARYYILDAHLAPCPVGVPGDLYIGGDCLALGYIDEPASTAEKFIPDPFADHRPPTTDHRPTTNDGEPRTKNQEPRTDDAPATQNLKLKTQNLRLYRTGDLARFWPDGNIEFLGRVDHQVKLRGFRIELGEIETLLGQHPAVRDVVVLDREDIPGEKRLVAYIVPKIEDRGLKIEDSRSDAPDPLSSILYPLSSELRSFLKERLPDYMVPSAFVRLDALPLTSNGKVDRHALPAPDAARPELEESFVAPRNAIEEKVAAFWTEVLGLERLGVHDNFFELGGHSLLATRVASRVRDTFQIELPLRRFFETPTVAGLAEYIDAAHQPAQGEQAPPILPIPRERDDSSGSGQDLPLSFAQERLWFLDRLQPGNPVYNVPTAMRITVPLHITALERSLNEIVRRHEVLRTTFATVADQPVQVVAPRLALALPLHDLQHVPPDAREAEAQRRAAVEAQLPFDLAHGPLLRTSLLRLGPADHVLLLTMHHIVSDGWSMSVLLRELGALYEAYAAGKPSPLPPLPIQYADYAHWQRQWLQEPGVRGQGPGAGGQGSGRQGDKETRRQETGVRSQESEFLTPNPQSPTPNTQYPTPNTQHPTPIPHPPSPIQAHLAYWKRQLAGAPPLLELPTDRPRAPRQTFRGGYRAFEISRLVAEGLAALRQREGVTLFMIGLTAFQALLHSYTGQDDLVVGTSIAGRTQVETENLIGLFVNQLVLRTGLSGNPSFRELLARVREVTLEAYAHQELPFERLVQELQPERSLSYNPLFQVMFVLQNIPTLTQAGAAPEQEPSAAQHGLQAGTGTSKLDLSLYIMERGRNLFGGFEYNTDLFEVATVERMIGQLETLLQAIVAQPDVRLAELEELLAEADRQQRLVKAKELQGARIEKFQQIKRKVVG